MTLRLGLALTLVGAVCIWVNALQAQVGPTQTGSLLDSSFQIGSGGYNRVVGGIGGVNSQMYVTGQVTGLRAFSGRVGYFAENQLNLNVPSADLGTFRRQSVGAQDVLEGQPYLASPYYERTQTVLQYPGLERGLNIPGSNAPWPRAGEAGASYEDARLHLAPPSALTSGGTLSGTALSPLSPAPWYGQSPRVVAGSPERQAQDPLTNLSDRQRLELARQLVELRRRQEDRRAQEQEAPSQQVQARLEGQTGPQPEQLIPGQIEPRTPEPGPAGAEPVPEAGQSEEQSPQQVQTNQDVFYDLLRQMREQELAGQEAQDQERPVAVRPRADQPARITPAAADLPGEEPSAMELPQPLVEPLPTQGLVVHGLAGLSPDLVNLYLSRAQTKLSQGEFHDAARDYEIACTLDPRNPLPYVGAGLSLFAAGEPLSAAMRLRKSMEVFPPIVQTRIDVAKMIPDKEALDYRLRLLEERLARTADDTKPLLVFVAAFMHHNLGDSEQAAQYARQLRQYVDHPVYGQYANQVLQEPPQTQPAQEGSVR